MKNNISKKLILSFFRENPIISIAVTDGKQPISSIVLASIYNDFTFYFITGTKSYKTKAIKKNDRLSFSLWALDGLHVQGYGQAQIIKPDHWNEKIIDKLLALLTNHDKFWPPLASFWKQDYVLVKVKIKWLKALKVSDIKIKSEGNQFKEFIF